MRKVAAAVAVITVSAVVGTGASSAAGPVGHIGNRTWLDLNGNGLKEASEPGLESITFDLYDMSGKVLVRFVSQNGGWWGVNNLATDRCYRLRMYIPQEFRPSPRTVGGQRTQSSAGADGWIPEPICPTAAPQDDWDSGFVPIGAPPQRNGYVGNHLYDDRNTNGVEDPGEPRIPNVGIALLWSSDVVLGQGATSSDGWYGFRNLRTDNQWYSLRIAVPPGWEVTSHPLVPNLPAGETRVRLLPLTPEFPNSRNANIGLSQRNQPNDRNWLQTTPAADGSYTFGSVTTWYVTNTPDDNRGRIVVIGAMQKMRRADGAIVPLPAPQRFTVTFDTAPDGSLVNGPYAEGPNGQRITVEWEGRNLRVCPGPTGDTGTLERHFLERDMAIAMTWRDNCTGISGNLRYRMNEV